MTELRKQLIDQPLHILMCAASVLAISIMLYLLAVFTLWQNDPGGAVLPATVGGVLGTGLWVAIREYLQYPPRATHPWDVWLDATFEVGGMALGVWLFYSFVGPAFGGLQ